MNDRHAYSRDWLLAWRRPARHCRLSDDVISSLQSLGIRRHVRGRRAGRRLQRPIPILCTPRDCVYKQTMDDQLILSSLTSMHTQQNFTVNLEEMPLDDVTA